MTTINSIEAEEINFTEDLFLLKDYVESAAFFG